MSLWGNSDADEAKPKWLTAAEKKLTYATSKGWVFKKSANHQEEVLCATGELATSLGQATISSVEIDMTSFDVSAGGTLKVNVYYNEKVTVAGASPLMTMANSQAGGGSAATKTLTMDGSLPLTSEKLSFSASVGAAGSTISANDVLTIGAQSINLNGSTIVDSVGGGNAERAISAAQSTAAGSITAVA